MHENNLSDISYFDIFRCRGLMSKCEYQLNSYIRIIESQWIKINFLLNPWYMYPNWVVSLILWIIYCNSMNQYFVLQTKRTKRSYSLLSFNVHLYVAAIFYLTIFKQLSLTKVSRPSLSGLCSKAVYPSLSGKSRDFVNDLRLCINNDCKVIKGPIRFWVSMSPIFYFSTIHKQLSLTKVGRPSLSELCSKAVYPSLSEKNRAFVNDLRLCMNNDCKVIKGCTFIDQSRPPIFEWTVCAKAGYPCLTEKNGAEIISMSWATSLMF